MQPGSFYYKDGKRYLCITRIGKKLVFIEAIGDMIYKSESEAKQYFDKQ